MRQLRVVGLWKTVESVEKLDSFCPAASPENVSASRAGNLSGMSKSRGPAGPKFRTGPCQSVKVVKFGEIRACSVQLAGHVMLVTLYRKDRRCSASRVSHDSRSGLSCTTLSRVPSPARPIVIYRERRASVPAFSSYAACPCAATTARRHLRP